MKWPTAMKPESTKAASRVNKPHDSAPPIKFHQARETKHPAGIWSMPGRMRKAEDLARPVLQKRKTRHDAKHRKT